MLNKTLSTILLLVAGALAQTATPPSSQTTTPVKPAAGSVSKPGSTTAKPASQMAHPAAAANTSAKPVAKAPAQTSAKTTAKPAVKTTAKPAVKTAAKAPAMHAKKVAKPAYKASTPVKSAQAPPRPAGARPFTKTAGRRDPFVSPLRLQEDRMKSNPVCTTGAKCLIIEQVELKGVIKTQQGMIAMVENASKKQYNLREKDPVMNGQVMRITGDSLIFRETFVDNLGNQTTKEVVKKVTPPVI